jgi:proline iminopeptidase
VTPDVLGVKTRNAECMQPEAYAPPTMTSPNLTGTPITSSGPRRVLKTILGWIGGGVGLLLATTGGLAGFAGGIIGHKSLTLSIGIAVVATLLISVLMGSLFGRVMRVGRRSAIIGTAVLSIGLLSATWFVVRSAEGDPVVAAESASLATLAGLPEVQYVELSTGSRVAVWKVASTGGAKKSTPIVFLHGGPGMYTTASNISWGESARAAGYDTVYFDQAGGGLSDRLDVLDYSIYRAIDDVEALRVWLGAETMILWGQSWGASLASLYQAQYPNNVSSLILTSPGDFPGTEATKTYLRTARPDDIAVPPRLLATMAMISVNPGAADDFTDQQSAGKMFDAIVQNDLVAGGECAGQKPSAQLAGGGNVFVNRLLLSDLHERDVYGGKSATVPALVIRGECDFQDQVQADRFFAAYPSSKSATLSFPKTGHNLRGAEAELQAAVRSFLAAI